MMFLSKRADWFLSKRDLGIVRAFEEKKGEEEFRRKLGDQYKHPREMLEKLTYEDEDGDFFIYDRKGGYGDI